MNQKYISNCVYWKDWKNKLTKIPQKNSEKIQPPIYLQE